MSTYSVRQMLKAKPNDLLGESLVTAREDSLDT